MQVKPPKLHRVAFRVTAEQKLLLQQAAKNKGNSLSDFVLELILDRVQSEETLPKTSQLSELSLEQRVQIAQRTLESNGPTEKMRSLLEEGKRMLGSSK